MSEPTKDGSAAATTGAGDASVTDSNAHATSALPVTGDASIAADTPSLGPATGDAPFEFAVDTTTAEFINAQLTAEETRLASVGQKILRIPAVAFGIVQEKAVKPRSKTTVTSSRKGRKTKTTSTDDETIIYNRIELNTAFNTDNIVQLLLGEPVIMPAKPGFTYRNVILFTSSARSPPLLCGYVYDSSEAYAHNDLQHWMFINSAGKKTVIRVDGLRDIS